PPTRTRTPRPDETELATSSTSPARTASDSDRRSTWRASAYAQRPSTVATRSSSRSSTRGFLPRRREQRAQLCAVGHGRRRRELRAARRGLGHPVERRPLDLEVAQAEG